MLNILFELLSKCSSDKTKFPATELYCEGWMLRIILDWFSKHPDVTHEISIPNGTDWFSEAQLPSTFLPRSRGDKFGEGYTHADGVIGQFTIGHAADADLALDRNAKRFVVTEAKMFSKLSPKVSNASYYNQAARNVACIAEVVRRANLNPEKLERLGFYVLAPETRINEGIFARYMKREHILKTVKRRIDEYEEPKQDWFGEYFMPVFKQIDIRCIAWEEINNFIIENDPEIAAPLSEFYDLCLKFNKNISKRYD